MVISSTHLSVHRLSVCLKGCRIAVMLLIFLAMHVAWAQTTYTVTDSTDNPSDTGSLRYAVNQVNAGGGGDTINFTGVIGSITLTNGTLAINKGVTISGPGANVLTISGNKTTTPFFINRGITVSISGLTIANGNAATGTGPGGGIVNEGTLTVSASTLSENVASDGGAIANYGTLTVNDSTFSSNTAQNGGGIANGGIITVNNSTFYANIAESNGGGGIFNNGGSTLTVSNSTLSGNSAFPDGGGIFNNNATVTLTNSIIAGNSGGDCDQCGAQSTNNQIGGTPDLGQLRYNGGPTKTMLPLPGSPAIGAGSATPISDQRGFARPLSLASDLGAVETNYLTVNTLEDADSIAGGICTGGTAQCSLREAVDLASASDGGDILFQSGLTGTITLSNGLGIDGDVNIQGPGASKLTISDNQVSTVFIIFPGVTAAISGLTIANGKNNIDYDSGGGGLINTGSVATIENCKFSGNSSTSDGGAIIQGFGTLMVENSTFLNNSAVNVGGGILNDAILVLNNSTFFGNTAFSAGAIFDSSTFAGGGFLDNIVTALINDSTIVGNTASNDGGGIENGGGRITLFNSVLAGNVSTLDPGEDCYQCGTQSAANMVSTSSAPITAAQLNVGPLAYNGPSQTVQTFLPLPGSPLIQAGNPTLLPYDLTIDERGLPRIVNSKLDLGAVETNYTSVQFVQQPTNSLVNVALTPAVTLSVTESGAAVANVSVPLTFNGSGTLSGTLAETTMTPQGGGMAVATFSDLKVNALGSGDTLATSLTVTPAGVTPAETLTATSSPFNIIAPGFSLSASPAAVTLRQGQTGTATLTVTPHGDYRGAVKLSCAGLPMYAACSVAPTSVTLDGTGKAMTAQLAVTTQGPNTGTVAEYRGARQVPPESHVVLAAIFWLPGLLLGGWLAVERKRFTGPLTRAFIVAIFIGLTFLGALTGCSGSSKTTSSGGTPAAPTSTPTGTYTVTVTATPASGASQTIDFTLVVTQ